MDYNEKTVKLSKKVKLKSLKQVIDLCLKNKLTFSIGKNDIDIETTCGNEVTFRFNQFDKEHTIKYVELDYDYQTRKLTHETYHTNSNDFPGEMSIFFTSFPKLTKKQKQAPVIPPPPKVLNTLPEGDGHTHYDMKHLENGTVTVGCNEFSKKQVENIFKFLGECLEYDVEK